jgi:nucleotide-binding universal stress UspA family protein
MSQGYQFIEPGIKKILIPVDFSSVSLYALDYSAMIAHEAEADIHILHTVGDDLDKAAMVELRKAVDQKLDDIRTENSNLWGIKLTHEVGQGKLQEEIFRAVEQEKIDLVVMGTEGGAGITNWTKYYYGSNAYRTASHISCPVITLKEGKKRTGINTIVFPIDVTKETAQKIERAIKLADTFDSTIHLLSISNYYDEFNTKVDELQPLVDEIAASLKDRGIRVTTKTYRNREIAETVMKYADDVDADLLMIMTRQESNINSFFLGSTAKKIISASPIPVLSMHPAKKS